MKPRGAAPRQPPEPSGRAPLKLVTENRAGGSADHVGSPPQARQAPSPGLTYGVEPFFQIARDLPRLFQAHWEEADERYRLPLEPDWDLLYQLSEVGRLHIMTARYGKMLVGYISNLVLPSILSVMTRQAQIHHYYLHPIYRDEPGFVMRWFRANDEYLVSLGVRKIFAVVDNTYRDGKMGVVFKRLGYEALETNYGKMVP